MQNRDRSMYQIAKDWKQDGNQSVIHYMSQPVKDVDTSFDLACRICGFDDVVRHKLKHTTVTWAFQGGMRIEDAVDYFATSAETLMKVCEHHLPHYQGRATAVTDGIGDDIAAEHQLSDIAIG